MIVKLNKISLEELKDDLTGLGMFLVVPLEACQVAVPGVIVREGSLYH